MPTSDIVLAGDGAKAGHGLGLVARQIRGISDDPGAGFGPHGRRKSSLPLPRWKGVFQGMGKPIQK